MSMAWWKAAGIRAARTAAQTAVGMITVGAALSEIDWLHVVSVSVVAAIMSLLMSVGGLTEVEEEDVQ